jgi:hypothetical protein
MRRSSCSLLAVVAALHAVGAVGCGSPSLGRPAATSAERQGLVRVHVDPEGAALGVAEDDKWMLVCRAPCNVNVPLAPTYRLFLPDYTSPPFDIEAKPKDRVDLEVSAGTGARAAGGVVLIVVGAVSIPAGFVLFAMENIGNGDLLPGDGHSTNHYTYGGLAVSVVGAVGVVAGIVMVATSHSAGVDQSVRPKVRAKKPATSSPDRAATWRAPTEIDRRAPRVTTVPFFSGSF